MIVTTAYSVKQKGNTARIYISLKSLLSNANLKAGSTVKATFTNSKVTVVPCEASHPDAFKVLATSRGAVLEIRRKELGDSLKRIGRALVSSEPNKITIVPHPTELERIKREQAFMAKLTSGKPMNSGSLFSGIGLKNLHFNNGLAKAGIKTQCVFANDLCEKALDVSKRCNPMWNNAPKRAQLVAGDIRQLMSIVSVPKLDVLDISYPCNGQTTLSERAKRDIDHPLVGDLFIDVVAFIRKSSPALITLECTPAFNNSKTLKLMEQSLYDYEWRAFTMNSADHGSIENRKRSFVVAISKGLRHLLNSMDSINPVTRQKPVLGDFLEDIAPDSPLWKTFGHVLKKVEDDRLCFQHQLLDEAAQVIPTLIATYSCPKIGSPFVRHPSNPKLMRLLTPLEHARIKQVPESILTEIQDIVSGESPVVSKRGSVSLAHRLLGMSVERLAWEDAGEQLGNTIFSNTYNDLLAAA